MLKHLAELGPTRKMDQGSCIAVQEENQPSAKYLGRTLPQTDVVALQLSMFSVRCVSDTADSQRPGGTLWSPSTGGLRWSRAFPHQSCTVTSLVMNFYSFFRAGLGLISVCGRVADGEMYLAFGPGVAVEVVASCSMCVRLEGGQTSATRLLHWRERGGDQKMDMK